MGIFSFLSTTVLRVIPITVWVSRMLPLWCVVISSHKCCTAFPLWASLVAQRLKHLPAMQETWVRSLDREDPLEKEMATHSRILAWRIPWTEEPGGLQSTGSQRVRNDWATSLSLFPLYWWWASGLFHFFAYYEESCYKSSHENLVEDFHGQIFSFLLGRYLGVDVGS